MRWALSAFALSLTVTASHGDTLDLYYRPGGLTDNHLTMARQWKRQGVKIRIRDWQMSAAGLQVIYFKMIAPDSICHGVSGFNARPAIYLHQPAHEGRPVKAYRSKIAKLLGPRNARVIGTLPWSGFKRFDPEAFGIKPCSRYAWGHGKGKTVSEATPSLYRP